ncbi:transmembrane amino acid transporter protein-domain-containing protein, partial [Clohesyomyces aquaticus]
EDPVFGNEGAAIHYRTMNWWHAGIRMFKFMLAETISLGVLALPQAVALLGLAPGLFLAFMIGVMATYTGYINGQFKEKYPAMQSLADCGELIGGFISPFAAIIGREFMAGSQILILVFIMGAHILSFAIALNAVTDYGACIIVFSVFGLAICFSLTLQRTLKAVSYYSIFSCGSAIVAVTDAMIAIGVAKPDMGRVVAVHNGLPPVKGVGPAMNICLAYAGHVAFFGFCAELKYPKDFPKALAFMQITAITFYMLVSAIIQYYAGPLVASPALGPASPIIRKVAFRIALPTIIVAGVVNGSVACKYIYVRMWRRTDTTHQKSFKTLGSWIGICGVAWVISSAITEAVPSFNQLLGLIVSAVLNLPISAIG